MLHNLRRGVARFLLDLAARAHPGGPTFLDPECEDLLDFRTKFGFPVSDEPRLDPPDALDDRVTLLLEEVTELKDAAGLRSLPGVADALVDIVYLAKGAAVGMGLPWMDLWDDVHRANMTKRRGAKAGRSLATGDVTKPPGWLPPQTTSVLIANGWDWQEEGRERPDATWGQGK